MVSVTVYAVGEACQQCRLTCRALREVGIAITIVDLSVSGDAATREYVTSELGYGQAPVVVVDDEPEHHWCGFRPDLIRRLAGERR